MAISIGTYKVSYLSKRDSDVSIVLFTFYSILSIYPL